MVGLFYYGYSPFSLVAGVAMDRLGPRSVVPIGAAVVGIGALLFATGNTEARERRPLPAGRGRRVRARRRRRTSRRQNFPASRAATLIGATQMFGMAGGSAGPVRGRPDDRGAASPWSAFWIGMGVAGLVIARAAVPAAAEARARRRSDADDDWLQRRRARARRRCFAIRSRMLCGMIAGLLFIPTTIFDMIWGVRYLQEAQASTTRTAVMRSATVPIGWIIGCPLLGFISDRIGRRKPVIVGGAVVLLGVPRVDPLRAGRRAAAVRARARDRASRRAPRCCRTPSSRKPTRRSSRGTATGVINFLNFTFSALLGPVFGWLLLRAAAGAPLAHEHYQAAFRAAAVRRRARDRAHASCSRKPGRGRAQPTRRSGRDVLRSSSQQGTSNGQIRRAACEVPRGCAPVPTAVAHPCEATALAGAVEAHELGLDHADPRRPGREDPRGRARSASSISSDSRSSMRRTATRRPTRRSSSCAKARPSC